MLWKKFLQFHSKAALSRLGDNSHEFGEIVKKNCELYTPQNVPAIRYATIHMTVNTNWAHCMFVPRYVAAFEMLPYDNQYAWMKLV